MPLKVFLTTPPLVKIVEPIYDKPSFVRNSLASLAGYLRFSTDAIISCCDAKFQKKYRSALLQDIIDFNPDILGISAFTYEIDDAGKLAEDVKLFNKNCIVIVGGSHVSAIPEKTLNEFAYFDIGVIGEAELTLYDIYNCFNNGLDLHNILGIVFRNSSGDVLCTPKREKIKDLDIIQIPAWDLLPKAKEYYIQTTRGCPFNCNFCFNPNGHSVRKRSVKNIIGEMKWLILNMKPVRISLGDEAFGADHEFAHELLDEMIRCNIGAQVKWDIQTHVSLLDEALVVKMKKANVRKIEMGVESGNEEILINMGKGVTSGKIEKAFSLVKNHKIPTGAFLIFGHPYETKETIKESMVVLTITTLYNEAMCNSGLIHLSRYGSSASVMQ